MSAVGMGRLEIGQLIRQGRKAAAPPLTQQRLAAKIGCERALVGHMEKGLRMVSHGRLQDIIRAFERRRVPDQIVEALRLHL